MNEAPATDVDRRALETIRRQGYPVKEISLPNWPYDSLNIILFAASAAAFEELNLNHDEVQLNMQT